MLDEIYLLPKEQICLLLAASRLVVCFLEVSFSHRGKIYKKDPRAIVSTSFSAAEKLPSGLLSVFRNLAHQLKFISLSGLDSL